VKRVETALWLQPSDPGPTATRASIFLGAAQTAAASSRADRAGAVLDDVSLALDSYREGIRREPADWTLRYDAGVVALDLMLATKYADGKAPDIDFAQLVPTIPGLIDWSSLAGSQAPGPGQASGSLVDMPSDLQEATNYRNMSSSNLGQLALDLLATAKEQNPLASQIDAAASTVRAVTLPDLSL